MDKRNPNYQQYLRQPVKVGTSTLTITHGDFNKTFYNAFAGTSTYTLPQATVGAGPFYFMGTTNSVVINVATGSGDNIAGLGGTFTLPNSSSVNTPMIGLICIQAGAWSPIDAGGPGGTLVAPVRIAYGGAANTGAVPTLTVLAPGSDAVVTETGRALMVGGQPNAYTAEISASATSGQSFGLLVRAGTTSADVAFQVENQAATAAMCEIFGDGHGFIGAQIGGGGGMFWDVNSAFTINTPGAGITLTIGKAATGTPSLSYVVSQGASSAFWRHPGNIDIGTSGGDYGSVGYNFRTTTTAGSYQSDVTDLASKIRFQTGGFIFETAPSVAAGSAQTYTTRMTITSGGAFSINAGAGQGTVTGWGTPTGAAIVANFPGATATLVQCSNVIAKLITDLKAWGFYGA